MIRGRMVVSAAVVVNVVTSSNNLIAGHNRATKDIVATSRCLVMFISARNLVYVDD